MDFLIPLFTELKESEKKFYIEVIFLQRQAYDQLQNYPFLFNEFNRVVDKCVVLPFEDEATNITSKLYRKLYFMLEILKLAVRLATHKDSILLHTETRKSLIYLLLRCANKLCGGMTYSHRASMVIKFEGLPLDYKGVSFCCDGYLSFGPLDRTFTSNLRRLRVEEIGYPKLFDSWQQRLRSQSYVLFKEEIVRLFGAPDKNVITIICGSTVEGVFGLDEFNEWLRSAYEVVKCEVKGARVVVKPHPMQHFEHLKSVLEELDDVGVSFLQPAVLAAHSRIVISHHSSAIIDAMATGTPTIHYQKFTPHWLVGHPNGSSYLELGPLCAQNPEELAFCIRQALSDDFEGPDLKSKLLHKRNLSFAGVF